MIHEINNKKECGRIILDTSVWRLINNNLLWFDFIQFHHLNLVFQYILLCKLNNVHHFAIFCFWLLFLFFHIFQFY